MKRILLIALPLLGLLVGLIAILRKFFVKSTQSSSFTDLTLMASNEGVGTITSQAVYTFASPSLSASDTFRASSDGLTLSFNIPHSFNQIPSYVSVNPLSEDAQGFSYVGKSENYITIFYNVAPPVGVDNLIFNYSIIK